MHKEFPLAFVIIRAKFVKKLFEEANEITTHT